MALSQEVNFNASYCVVMPPRITSHGIGVPGYSKGYVLQYGLPQLELQMVVFFTITQVCNFILRPFGFPLIVSQLLGGIILGPTVLGKNEVVRKTMFPEFNEKESHAQEISDALQMFGYTIFLFLTGLKMDLSMLLRVGYKSWITGVTSLIFPLLAGGSALAVYTGLHNQQPHSESNQLFFTIVEQSSTHFPVVSCLLADLKLMNSELGRLALSSSLVSNIMVSLVVLAVSAAKQHPFLAFMNIALMIAFILSMVFLLRPAMRWIIRQTPEGRPVKDIYLHAIVSLVLLSALISLYAGQTILLGCFIMGLAVPDGPPLGSALVSRLESIFTGILLPLYVTASVARADFSTLLSDPHKLTFDAILIVIIFVVKMAASLVPPLICKMPFNDSMALALILCSSGIVQLANYRFLHDQKLVDARRYAMLIIAILISATVTPILVRRLFDNSRKFGGYQTRNVVHLKPDMELPVVTCIHRPNDIDSMIGLLGCLSPSRDSPMGVYAVHLLKLVGQGTPVLISHQQQRRVAGKSQSDNVILAFNNYARSNMGAVHVNLFTAISPPKLMYEDVCHIALDKLSSLIVLPYHCRWSPQGGKVESEDGNIRALNVAVLQRAPCSVAILVDRGHLGEVAATKPHLHVGMFYIGGDDDREALALAKRMGRDEALVLTVVHLVEELDEGRALRLDEVMDDEVLVEVRGEAAGQNVRYRREVVQDGPQSALLVRSLVNEFDLIVVGRRYGVRECAQTSGLNDWTEVAELGVLGDLLASPDLHTDASVLVVQQQQKQR